jgi:hypothetical protein
VQVSSQRITSSQIYGTQRDIIVSRERYHLVVVLCEVIVEIMEGWVLA